MVPKKRGPKPTGIGQQISVRLQPPLLQALDDWRSDQPGAPNRPEAIRRIVAERLKT